MEACNDIASVSFSLKAQVESMLHNQEVIAQRINAVQYQVNESSAAAGRHCVRNSRDYVEISRIVVFANLLTIILHTQM